VVIKAMGEDGLWGCRQLRTAFRGRGAADLKGGFA